MTSRPAGPLDVQGRPDELIGHQEPRILLVPEYRTSAGQEAIELAESAGLVLDPWQKLVLHHALGERDDGKWAAFEVGLVVPRQNGKGSILEARELAGLFLFGERLIIHSAHLFDTSMDHMRRVLDLIEANPDLDRRVKRVSRSHGEEGIELRGGQRLRFKTRTTGGGRGLSGDTVILDEAYNVPEAVLSALMPTMAARSVTGSPQLWYTSSPVDQKEHAHGHVLARVRRRGLTGDGRSLGYFEWSVPEDVYAENPKAVATDPAMWALANPGMGIRISAEYIGNEQESMGAAGFAVERLGIGDWPEPKEDEGWAVIAQQTWSGLADVTSKLGGRLAIAVDVAPDRGSAAIGAAGRRPDGRVHVEVVDHRPGTRWTVGRVIDLVERHGPCVVVIDDGGPAGSLIKPLRDAGVTVVVPTARQVGQACGGFYDAVTEAQLRHLNQEPLTAALAGAQQRPLGDAWAWARRASTVDISPLVAVTFALWGAESFADGAPNLW